MNYREKFEAYKKGSLSPEEAEKIEEDIEKFSVIMEYFDDKIASEPIPVLNTAEEDFSFSEQIDKLINKRIKKSTVRILFTALFFAAFFIMSLGGYEFLSVFGIPEGAVHFLNGILSAIYYAVNFWLLYLSFTRKKLKSAIFLICWNTVLIALSFIFSVSMGDAVPFANAIVLGFFTLPQYIGELFDSDAFYNVWFNIGALMIPLSIVMSVIAIIVVKKKKTVRPLSAKALKVLLSVFIVFAVAISGASTAVSYKNGYFLNDYLGNELTKNEIYKLDDDFIRSNPLDKTDEELKEILKKYGYRQFKENNVYKKDRSDNLTAYVTFGEINDEYIRSVNLQLAYCCINPTAKPDKIKKISAGEYFNYGDDESYVLNELCLSSLFPRSITFSEDNGTRYTTALVRINIKENESYPEGYSDHLKLEFENGKLISCSGWYNENE